MSGYVSKNQKENIFISPRKESHKPIFFLFQSSLQASVTDPRTPGSQSPGLSRT